jgi:uroporphyrinogen decarboxylase
METSRDRILKAINHVAPESCPVNLMGFEDVEKWLRHFAAADYASFCRQLGVDDLQDVLPMYVGRPIPAGLDIWGALYTWAGAEGRGYSQDRGGYPLARVSSTREVEHYRWPRAEDFDYATVTNGLRAIPADKARWVRTIYGVPQEGQVRSEWLPVLCTLFNLFSLEETLMNFHLQPEVMEAAVAKIEEFLVAHTERLLEAAQGQADIFWCGDDFATRNGPMISPQQWRRFLKPTYKKLFALGKSHGLKVWFHSCGTFQEVLPDLIEIGMDVWETAQVHLPGNEPEVLKREYGKDITFYGAVNSQKTLPFGTPEDVRAEVRERIRVLGRGGGYICSSDHTIMPDVPFENVLAMIDEAKKFRF